MPKCKKCDKCFKTHVVIDGKKKNLCNRKYCLDCSPFGMHNTRKVHVSNIDKNNVICSICEKVFSYSRKKGDLLNTCASCIVTRHRQRLKLKLIEYKGGKCQVCEYSKSVYSLDFHHIDPKKKSFSIGGKSISLEKLKIEADKCVLVCGNCHGEIHEELGTKGYSDIVNKIIER